ncbi:MAG: repeat-containing protein [Cytophagaceae bacterium]|jgi:tetratricopeptide (TPR) repeat protein|nr:repeat-containing protein [Cytophagaceae bacterium]
MKPTLHLFISLFLFSLRVHNLQAQSSEDKALAKAQEAIKLVDEGKYAEGIKLLEDAQKLDPKNTTYPYEIAYAYYAQKDYKKAIKYLEPLMKQNNAKENVYQLVGNAYDLMGNKNKALSIYDEGLKRFPTSGSLHLERGNMQLFKEDYDGALAYYEKGIEVAPKFASNYYWASRIYWSSSEKVWGMLYGEIFINLEPNTKRAGEISKLLYDTYKQGIEFTSDTSMTVSFSKHAVMSVSELEKGGAMKMPFGTFVYEVTLLTSIVPEKKIDLASLNRIRTNFVDLYHQNKNNTKYPNVLFDYQQQVITAGHFEAYNYWLLGKGEEAAFSQWRTENKAKWDAFVDWFNENKLSLNKDHKFYRQQY